MSWFCSVKFQGLKRMIIGLSFLVYFFFLVSFSMYSMARLMTELFPDPHLPYRPMTIPSSFFHSRSAFPRDSENFALPSKSSFFVFIGASDFITRELYQNNTVLVIRFDPFFCEMRYIVLRLKIQYKYETNSAFTRTICNC